MLNVMEDYEFLKRVGLEEAKELCPAGEKPDEFIKPYNYIEVLHPKPIEELRRLSGVAPPVGSEETSSSTKNSDEGEGKRKEATSLKDLI